MMATKRGADDLAGTSDVNKRSCSGDGERSESVESDQLCDVVMAVASGCVVSIAVSNDRGVLFACSGIAVERQNDFTKFLTSASLVRAFKDATAMKGGGRWHDIVQIEVRSGRQKMAIGRLEEYDLDHEIAVVSIRSPLDVSPLDVFPIVHGFPEQYSLHSEVVAVGRHVSDSLLMRSRRLVVCSWAIQSANSEYLMFSTCEFSEVLCGGPLFTLGGTFLGMNLLSDISGTIFMPRSVLFERFEHLRTFPQRRVFLQLLRHSGTKN